MLVLMLLATLGAAAAIVVLTSILVAFDMPLGSSVQWAAGLLFAVLLLLANFVRQFLARRPGRASRGLAGGAWSVLGFSSMFVAVLHLTGVQSLGSAATTAKDLAALVERRDVSGASFAFSVPKGGDFWSEMDGKPHRSLLDVTLHEITVCSNPAYPDTEVARRALEFAYVPVRLKHAQRYLETL